MIVGLPMYLIVSFVVTTLFAVAMVWFLINTSSKSIGKKSLLKILTTISIFLIIQAVLSLFGFYKNYPNAVPPKIVLLAIIPSLMTIIVIFNSRKGKLFIDSLSMQMLTYVHIIRIPVELVLYGLFVYGAIPEIMTFEGRNMDIFAGITAPLVGFFGVSKGKMGKGTLLLWNFICLGLLLNIVVHAILSAPSPFQQFGFDQPNVAILNFPFSWLPAFIVPLVLFAHLAAIRKLINYHKTK
ncbi:MAG: hypothetical protein EOO85_12130 [Pedobacter sp.]|nr:MAG: hypothetical protein EOO85_12130 [Pedobacter sp.]